MRRGEVWLVELDPARGSKANKVRPAVLVSNDAANEVSGRLGRGTVTVVPVTSSASRAFPFQVALAAGEGGLERESKAQAEQVRSLDVTRLERRLGALSPTRVGELDSALRIQLDL